MSTTERRAELRKKLIELARREIAVGGAKAIKARALSQAAGCSVGAIYTVFGDLGDLVLEVNADTFRQLGAKVHSSLKPEQSPLDQMISMSMAYMDFANENPMLWRTLFEAEASIGSDVPDWYVKALDGLMAMIDQPVAAIFGEADPITVRLQTKSLFSAVHGIVLLGVEDRLSSVGRENMHDMIRFLLTRIAT
jgi:AcrR family transcriptional regulator